MDGDAGMTREEWPQGFIDGGDVPWAELEFVIRRALQALLPGRILELISSDRRTIETLPSWCDGEGIDLLGSAPGDGTTTFRLTRRSGEGG